MLNSLRSQPCERPRKRGKDRRLRSRKRGHGITLLVICIAFGLQNLIQVDKVQDNEPVGADRTGPHCETAALAVTSVCPLNHSCPLGWGQNKLVEACVLETAVIVLLTVLIHCWEFNGDLCVHCAPLLHHYTTSYFIQTMAYAICWWG